MISFDEAIEIIGGAATPLGTEVVLVAEAHGRVLGAPVIAAIDSPRADVSAMDGYAVRGDDLGAYPVRLKVVGQSLPGIGFVGESEPGTCGRIFTGAPLPQGADRIVIQEQVRREGDVAIIDGDPGPGTWVREKGKDFAAGDEVLSLGHLLDPAGLIALAGADVAEVCVFRRPRIALITTGDELVEPGRARNSRFTVPDSVSLGLTAFAVHWGADVAIQTRFADDLESMRFKAKQALDQADIVIVAGGASVGERDFAKAMFEPQLELLFSKISMRPGKPAWFGRIGDKLMLGLPGNPTSALVTARLLLAPLLCAMQGRGVGAALGWQSARLGSPLPACDMRETFHRARLERGEAVLLNFQESHAQKALAEANILVRQAANAQALSAGQAVQTLSL
jgi:molybdopterin molybdotransferase